MNRRVLSLFRPYARQILLITVLILVSAGLGAALPFLTREMVDEGLFAPGGARIGLLCGLLAVMAALTALGGGLGVLQSYLAGRMGQDVMERLRGDLYAHLQRMPLTFFTRTRTGEIQSRVIGDVAEVQTTVGTTVPTMLANVLTCAATLAAMFALSWRLTLVTLALLPVAAWLTARVAVHQRRVIASVQRSRAEMNVIAEETLSVSGILLARVFGRTDHGVRRFQDESRRLSRLQLRAAVSAQALGTALQALFLIMPPVVYVAAGFAGALTPGTLLAFTSLQARLFLPAGQLMQVTVQFRAATAVFERIFEYLDRPPAVVDEPGALAVRREETRGEIRLDRVTFRHDDQPALQDVTLTIRPGQFAAVVGESGSGKTTLTHLVMRLHDPDHGRIALDGTDLRRLTRGSLAALFGVVTQEPVLLHATIADNLRYAKPAATMAELEAACRAASIHDRIMRLPDGYDSVVGERGSRLSGGEKQRLAIARAILNDPRILVLDEATSALDAESEQQVQQALLPLLAGRTTIAVTHRLDLIRTADVIFVLHEGRLVEQGTHDELINTGGRYAELHRHWSRNSPTGRATAEVR
ncbi:ABC transporter ATP-binding protein [Thermomonospora cellulosilytica]|uniref:ATP-binding cassette subfamily B protein n=1 Tax=Thermomonospora cellulosilytica TaxID=1411118 RepID=A0A7W3R7A1_9ACTN|nr:ABC transporter ATP-binding protein [Thermomonospora cellulosilytica]MBA9002477.1 ATP-binding cassette subfamily B protein [Thermomonospora cellulosilytica]